MSPSPETAEDQVSLGTYAQGWTELMELARGGYSWSGHEKNVAFLNLGGTQPTFADISSISALNGSEDGRAIALTDWDQDGDVDLWMRNRTAPRLKFLRNNHDSVNSLSLRLEGVDCNRDAIGAVVEVIPADATNEKRLVKSVRAGDLFLSQSSKWIHFGLGNINEIENVSILWPGGKRESFPGMMPGGRYHLKQGTGRTVLPPKAREGRSTVIEEDQPAQTKGETPDQSAGATRIVLPARVPLPFIVYRKNYRGDSVREPAPTNKLLLLWSVECSHCLEELKWLADSAAPLKAAGLDVLALSIDTKSTAVYQSVEDKLTAQAFPFEWGFIQDSSLLPILRLQDALFDRKPERGVPLSFLLDSEHRAVAIYRGPNFLEQLLEDSRRLLPADPKTLFHLAPPFQGTWFTNPLTGEPLEQVLNQQYQDRLLLSNPSTSANPATTLAAIANKHLEAAKKLRGQQNFLRAKWSYEAALRAAPNSAAIHHSYGTMLGSLGQLEAAKMRFKKALKLNPELKQSRAALEMVERLIREENSRQ